MVSGQWSAIDFSGGYGGGVVVLELMVVVVAVVEVAEAGKVLEPVTVTGVIRVEVLMLVIGSEVMVTNEVVIVAVMAVVAAQAAT